MKKMILLVAVTFIGLAGKAQLTPAGETPTKEEFTVIYNKMLEAVKNAKYTKFRMVKNERYEGKIVKSNQICAVQNNPRKIYMNILEGPNSGTEILYVQGENDGDAYASAGKWVPTVSIDPYGSLARTKQRHTMFELGFEYTKEIIKHSYNAFINETITAENYQYGGIIKFDNRDVYSITLDNTNYKIYDYKVLAGEDIVKIARKLHLDEYGLLEMNPEVDDYDDVKEGQIIKVPSSFAKKVTMYIDTKTFMPVYQKISDLKGMIGEYEYHDVQINPVLKQGELTKDFDGYGF